ncbi:hypothetical protein EV385_2869 [Krasilnikovia cinnamomea]|uniref:Uncharacterized protein n=1 Tax=Krasilnikovia cinnamomea TaxID=349313 RepID=A0A4Q7ZKK6_9ACTN|nr:hypothetical protein EV385_2869 [Krasilnikovia cinnamomea]
MPVLISAVVLSWGIVAVAHLFGIRLWSQLGSSARGVYGLAWLVAVAVTVLAAVMLRRTGRFAAAATAVVVGALGATAIVTVDWTSAFVHGYYRLHRADFATVGGLARTGELAEARGLPANLRYLAVNGDPTMVGARAVWLPSWTGRAGGATGYAYAGEDEPADLGLDCRSGAYLRCWSLGDGWSWIEWVATPPTNP